MALISSIWSKGKAHRWCSSTAHFRITAPDEGEREAVARRHRYIAFTQRYFGTSPWPDSGEKFSLAAHADDLAVFIRELKVGPVRVVGWSYGGGIALALAVQHPKLLKALFLHESAGIASFVTEPADAN